MATIDHADDMVAEVTDYTVYTDGEMDQMTSPANPFNVDYGFQFEDGDDWDEMANPHSSRQIIGLPWRRMVAARVAGMASAWGSVPVGTSAQRLYDHNPGLPIHYCRDILGPARHS